MRQGWKWIPADLKVAVAVAVDGKVREKQKERNGLQAYDPLASGPPGCPYLSPRSLVLNLKSILPNKYFGHLTSNLQN